MPGVSLKRLGKQGVSLLIMELGKASCERRACHWPAWILPDLQSKAASSGSLPDPSNPLYTLCHLYYPHMHSKMGMPLFHAHLLPSSHRKLPGPGPAHPAPAAHSPSAGTRCRFWRPSGAQWGPRVAALRTPAAVTQHRLTAEERAWIPSLEPYVTADWVPCAYSRGKLPNHQSLLCTPFLSRARKRAQQEEPRQCGQASPSRASVSSFGEWRR